jgi:hypothetical protein
LPQPKPHPIEIVDEGQAVPVEDNTKQNQPYEYEEANNIFEVHKREMNLIDEAHQTMAWCNAPDSKECDVEGKDNKEVQLELDFFNFFSPSTLHIMYIDGLCA